MFAPDDADLFADSQAQNIAEARAVAPPGPGTFVPAGQQPATDLGMFDGPPPGREQHFQPAGAFRVPEDAFRRAFQPADRRGRGPDLVPAQQVEKTTLGYPGSMYQPARQRGDQRHLKIPALTLKGNVARQIAGNSAQSDVAISEDFAGPTNPAVFT